MSKGSKQTKSDKKSDQNKPKCPSSIRFKCCMQNTILDVMKNRGWTEIPGDGDFDFYWCDPMWMKDNFNYGTLEEHVKLSHFRNHYELTRKNLMVKNLKRMVKKIEKESGKQEAQKIDFFPTTYELPSEYHMFIEEFKRNPGTIWIMKPVAKSQGKGIFLFRRIRDIEAWKKGEYQAMGDQVKEGPETYVVSRYIDNPYLVCGRKFDIRIYILVTSYVPLRAWLYRDGFARFSNVRFSLDSIDDQYVHLTNIAVQKTAPDYDAEKGAKWSIARLRTYLTSVHGVNKVEELFQNMDTIFINTLLSVQKIIINDKHCFELYGYDILVDTNLKPWLIEINASPSLTASSKEDYSLKCVMLEDALNIIDMEGKLTGKEKNIGGFDLIWDDGPVTSSMYQLDGLPLINTSSTYNSFLGCINDRSMQSKKNALGERFKCISKNA